MDEHANSTTATTAVGALVIVLAVVSVALRFYTRYSTGSGFGWDDWLILLALCTTITTDVIVLESTSLDPSGPSAASDTDPSHVYTPADVYYTKLNYIATVLYFTITSSTKLSILFMYHRLFSVTKNFRYQTFTVGALVIAFWIGCTVANLLDCIPIQWTWVNSLDNPQYCFNYNIFWLASGSVEAVIDVLIISMPLGIIFNLRLDLTKKVALAAVFLLGIFVIVTGLVKVILSYAPGSREPSFNRTEVWTTVHCGIGMVCACLPVCWPLIVRIAKLRSALITKQWHKLCKSSIMQKCKKSRSTASDQRQTDGVTVIDLENPVIENTVTVGLDRTSRISELNLSR